MGVFSFVFDILSVSIILYCVVRAWKKADIQEKFSKAEEVEEGFEAVQEFETKHKDILDKKLKVNKFKKTTL